MKKFLVCLLTLALVLSMSAVSFAAEEDVISDNGAPNFADVNESDWFCAPVYWAYENGITAGFSAKRFGPGYKCTRAQVATFLYRAEGEPKILDMTQEGSNFDLHGYKDVSKDAYYYDAVKWANAAGIVNGTGNEKFKPDAEITREQLAAIVYRYAEYKGFDMTLGDDTNILSYDDIFDTAEYALPAFQWGIGAGVFEGMGSILGSKKTATRAQVVTVLFRLFTQDLMPLDITVEDLAGVYADAYAKNALMKISKPDKEGKVSISITDSSSSFESLVFNMTAIMYRDVLSYSDCNIYDFLFDSEIQEGETAYYILPIDSDVSGYFVVKRDGSIHWEGANYDQYKNCVFLKIGVLE